ncbi:MAG: hypothetical protein ABSE89_09525 [Sedimentisphaerales bacterium]
MHVDRNILSADGGIPNDFIEIVDLVEKATKDKRINWVEDPPGSEKIIIRFERFQIALWLEEVEAPDLSEVNVWGTVFFEVQSNEGHPVGGICVNLYVGNPTLVGKRLDKLYYDAFTQARNLNNALKQIEQELRNK